MHRHLSEVEFGMRIASRMTESLDHLPDQILRRLQAARYKALSIHHERGDLNDLTQGSHTTKTADYAHNESKKCH